jgi:hypothetical protein
VAELGHDFASRPIASNGRLGVESSLSSTDPLEAREKGGFLTSLGGSPENSSYKGYGLAVMVNILGSCLSGATLITDPMAGKNPQGNDIGHCFFAIDPGLFRDREEFAADVTRFCNDLRATKPVDPARPVMVAGDPQWNNAAKRMQEGIQGFQPACGESGLRPLSLLARSCWRSSAGEPGRRVRLHRRSGLWPGSVRPLEG